MNCTGPTGNGIKYSYIDSCGNLIFVYDNNFTNTVGSVLGPTGYTGFTGCTGATGPVGNGIDFVYMDSCCNLVMVMTNGNILNVGNFCCGCTGTTGSCDTGVIIYYGPNVPPVTATWPANTTPVPLLPPLIGNVYCDITTGCFYIFDGSMWETCPNQNSLFYGTGIPTGINWPVDTLPTPTSIFPTDGNVYVNDVNGGMYLYKTLTNTWDNFQSGSFVKYLATGMLTHFVPSTANQLYATEIQTDILTTGSFTKVLTISGTTINNVGTYWPPPVNSTYFVCNVKGVYNLTFGFDYNESTPSTPVNTGNVVLYVLDSSNNYTNQMCAVGENTTVILGVDYKIVIYTMSSNTFDNLLTFDTINVDTFFEFTRKY